METKDTADDRGVEVLEHEIASVSGLRPNVERADILLATARLQTSAAVLDFGCGYGETATAIAPYVREIVGVDSNVAAINYCRSLRGAIEADAVFESVQLHLPQIPAKVGTAIHISSEELAAKYDSYFDLIYSFEAFAMLEENEAATALRLFSRILRSSGLALLSCFLNVGFGPTDVDADRAATLCPNAMPISLERLLLVLRQENFRPVNISFGHWRTRRDSRARVQSAPDLVLIERQSEIPPNFSAERYRQLHPDVAAADIDPLEHYLVFGFYEGREVS